VSDTVGKACVLYYTGFAQTVSPPNLVAQDSSQVAPLADAIQDCKQNLVSHQKQQPTVSMSYRRDDHMPHRLERNALICGVDLSRLKEEC